MNINKMIARFDRQDEEILKAALIKFSGDVEFEVSDIQLMARIGYNRGLRIVTKAIERGLIEKPSDPWGGYKVLEERENMAKNWHVLRPGDDSYFACKDEADAVKIAAEINQIAVEYGRPPEAKPGTGIFNDKEHTEELAARSADEFIYFS